MRMAGSPARIVFVGIFGAVAAATAYAAAASLGGLGTAALGAGTAVVAASGLAVTPFIAAAFAAAGIVPAAVGSSRIERLVPTPAPRPSMAPPGAAPRSR